MLRGSKHHHRACGNPETQLLEPRWERLDEIHDDPIVAIAGNANDQVAGLLLHDVLGRQFKSIDRLKIAAVACGNNGTSRWSTEAVSLGNHALLQDVRLFESIRPRLK